MLVLASASPRRAELLRQIGVPFEISPADIDERSLNGEAAQDYVVRLAEDKAQAVFETNSDLTVLGSDTVVTLDGKLFGKPRDYTQFKQMMSELSGRAHKVMSGVTVLNANRIKSAISVTDVYFRDLNEEEIEGYWQTGEPRDKAGGYAIQGLAACFIKRIEGSYSGVMGLPLYETSELLRQFQLISLE